MFLLLHARSPFVNRNGSWLGAMGGVTGGWWFITVSPSSAVQMWVSIQTMLEFEDDLC
jgi:hypothetical protein